MITSATPRLLCINPFGIGDVLFTTPVIASFKAAYPKSFIGYWCNERVAPLLRYNPAVGKVFALSRGDLKRRAATSPAKAVAGLWGLVRGIKRERFDLVFDFSLDHRYSLLAKLLGIKYRIGFDYKGRGRFLTTALPLAGYQDRHVVDYYLELLQCCGFPVVDRQLHLSVPQGHLLASRRLLHRAGLTTDRPVVGICPGAGASWGKDAGIKHWPAESFARLAERLLQERGCQVVLLGDAAEKPLTEAIAAKMSCKVANLAGQLTLEEFVAVVSSLSLLVANDGGPLHIAVARGVATLSFFGPVDEKVYGPYPASAAHRVMTSQVDCRPCYRNFRLAACRKQRACLTGITVEQAFSAAAELLQ